MEGTLGSTTKHTRTISQSHNLTMTTTTMHADCAMKQAVEMAKEQGYFFEFFTEAELAINVTRHRVRHRRNANLQRNENTLTLTLTLTLILTLTLSLNLVTTLALSH